MKKLCLVLSLLGLSSLSVLGQSKPLTASSLTHDIRPIQLLSPRPHGRTPVGYGVQTITEFQNAGSADEDSVFLQLLIFDSSHKRVYADSLIVRNWRHGEVKDTSFSDFVPQRVLRYYVVLVSKLFTDENRSNDTVSTFITSDFLRDVYAVKGQRSLPSDSLTTGAISAIRGSFGGYGINEFYDVPVRCEIHRCSDDRLVFRSDTILSAMFVDSGSTSINFPLDQDTNHINRLAPGCYRVSILARQPDDGNRSNDTATSVLTIIPVPTIQWQDAILSSIDMPTNTQAVLVNTTITPKVFFEASVLYADSAFAVRAEIIDSQGISVYRDTVRRPASSGFMSGSITFKPFIPSIVGNRYTFIATTVLSDDVNAVNDTATVGFSCRAYRDGACNIGLWPPTDTLMSARAAIRPTVACKWLAGNKPSTPLLVTATLYPADSPYRFRASAYAPLSLYPDYFDSTGSIYHFGLDQLCQVAAGSIDSGLYRMAVVVHFRDDNPSNDTAWFRYYVRNNVDVSIDSIIGPNQYDQIIPHQPNHLSVLLKNRGIQDVANVTVFLQYRLNDTALTFADTVTVPSITSGMQSVTECKPFTPAAASKYHIIAEIYPRSDGNSSNNRVERWVYARYRNDVSIDSGLYPRSGDSLFQGSSFEIDAWARLQGTGDLQNVRVHAEIRPCTGIDIVYSADTVLKTLKDEGQPVLLRFPSSVGPYSTYTLPPNCYKLIVIAEAVNDENHLNDTATSTFAILTDLGVQRSETETRCSLGQNYPNPFSQTTTLSYLLPSYASVTITVYDVLGRSVLEQQHATPEQAGKHETLLDFSQLPSGTYDIELRVTDDSGRSQWARRPVVHSPSH